MKDLDIAKISQLTGYDLELLSDKLPFDSTTPLAVCKDHETDSIVVLAKIDEPSSINFGLVLTCFANTEAKVVIWVCEHATPEHFRMVDKLNDLTSDEYSFHLVVIP